MISLPITSTTPVVRISYVEGSQSRRSCALDIAQNGELFFLSTSHNFIWAIINKSSLVQPNLESCRWIRFGSVLLMRQDFSEVLTLKEILDV